MKNSTLLFILLSFSTSIFAAPCPYHPSLGAFLDQLVSKGSYTGERVQIVARGGTRPESSTLTATYTFTRTGSRIDVRSFRCSDDGQCESLSQEEYWRYSPINRCFYVNGIRVPIIRSGISDLRFNFTDRLGVMIRENFHLNTPKNLVINNTYDDTVRFQYIWFNGR
jgi:hypothetical protein